MHISQLINNTPLKLYWAFPCVIAIYAIFGNPNTPVFVWWGLLAAIACGLPLMVTKYDPLSFVSIWALLHALYFPIALVFSLIPSAPGVYESYLWEGAPLAMLALTVGMAGLAFGSKLTDKIWPTRTSRGRAKHNVAVAEKEILSVTPAQNLCLVFLSIPLALFQLATNTYYQFLAAGAEGWSEQNALSFGYTGYLEHIVCIGVFLQLRRYFISRTRRDLFFAIIALLLPLLVFLPSGSRDRALRDSIYPLLVAIFGFQKRFSIKFFSYVAGVILGIAFFMLAMETYRGNIYYKLKSPELTVTDRMELLVDAAKDSFTSMEQNFDSILKLWSRRLTNFKMVGRIVSVYPAERKFRGLADIEYWPIYLLPNPIRPATPGFDPRDSAILTDSVRLGSYSGSAPAMLIGDLYSRISWIGVFFGMAVVGLILRGLDKWLHRFGLFETAMYGILLISIANLMHDSVFGLFLFLTRNMLISFLIVIMLRKFFWKNRRNKSFLNLRLPIGMSQSQGRMATAREQAWPPGE